MNLKLMKGIVLFCMLTLTTILYARDKPNVVLIIADDVSWNDIGCYGNDVVKSPHIDRLAETGAVFTNHYV
ncbi:MAG: sulfatase-like hydrolase/transferase [Mariniphaga sp.]